VGATQGGRVLSSRAIRERPRSIGSAAPVEGRASGRQTIKRGVRVWPVNSGMA